MKTILLLLLLPALSYGQLTANVGQAPADTLCNGSTINNLFVAGSWGASYWPPKTTDSIYVYLTDKATYNTQELFSRSARTIFCSTCPVSWDTTISVKVTLTGLSASKDLCTYTVNNVATYPGIKNIDTVYVKNCALGVINISGNNYRIIKEVRYYTITGQLYGTYGSKQTNLPNVPLIEEVIYIDNSVSTRKLMRLQM
jgi:hypothetical protein